MPAFASLRVRTPRQKRRRCTDPGKNNDLTLEASTAQWLTKVIAHARQLLDHQSGHGTLNLVNVDSQPHGGNAAARGNNASIECLEAASMLAMALTKVPSLWAELGCDYLSAISSIHGRSKCLLIEAVIDVLPPVHELARERQAAASAVLLLCLLGDAEADEGHFIAAFTALRRAASLARRARDVRGEEQAETAMEALRTAALQRWHFHMVNDVERAIQYQTAIELAVRKLCTHQQSIAALDIGTGSGLLAMMCARLDGVRLVHACEMNDVLCAVAEETITSYRDSADEGSLCEVFMHPTVSTRLALAQKVDLIFCEIFDAGLLGEHALPTLFHAHAELLRDGGIMVPCRATIFGQLVESADVLERFGIVEPIVGFSFEGIQFKNQDRYTCELLRCLPHTAITDPMPLLRLDFTDIAGLRRLVGSWQKPVDLVVRKQGTVHALAFWWQLDLDADGACKISSAPNAVCNSWEQAICPLVPVLPGAPGIRAQVGSTLSVHARVQEDGVKFTLSETLEAEKVHGFGNFEKDSPTLVLTDDEFIRMNDVAHWESVRRGILSALVKLHPRSSVQIVDLSEGPLPMAALLGHRCCKEQFIPCRSVVLGIRNESIRPVIKLLVKQNLGDDALDDFSMMIATPCEVIQAALPAPFPPDPPSQTSFGPAVLAPPAALVLCEDVVHYNGGLRTGVLEDLMLLWLRCTASVLSNSRQICVVPDIISVNLTLVESIELARRHRVVESPGGINVNNLNTLAVSTFIGLDAAVMQPRLLSAEVEALTLPTGSLDLPQVLQQLSNNETLLGSQKSGNHRVSHGHAPFLVRVRACQTGYLHGVLTRFQTHSTCLGDDSVSKAASCGTGLPQGHACFEQGRCSRRLAGFTWPVDSKSEAIRLDIGDVVTVEVRYSSSRGLSFSPSFVERCEAT